MMRFLDFLFPPRADELLLRDVSPDNFLTLMAPHLVDETRPGTVALFRFGSPVVRSVIHEAKYHGNNQAFNFLVLALAEYLCDCDDIGNRMSYVCLVPIPLGKERHRERGFNQAEEVAKRVALELGIRMKTDLLIRTRETVSQVSLRRQQRKENMRGAFRAEHPVDPSHIYIVLDDVITTGATLQAAIDALKAAGAEHIIPLALAC